MTGYPRDDVAQQAGVKTEYVTRLVELGILKPGKEDAFSAGDVRRTRMVQSLERAGVPLQGIAAALKSGHLSLAFFDLAYYDRFSGLSDRSFQELSAETAIPLALLMVVREAIGSAQPRPEDQVRDDELQIVPVIALQLARGFRPSVVERWLRAYGESLRRIAETEADWWHTEVEVPLLESGMGEGEMLEVSNQWGAEITVPLEKALLAIYHAQQEHAWTKNIIEDVQNALDRAGLQTKLARPPAISFLDMTGYTRLTEEQGDEAAADLAAQMARLVERTSREHWGKLVKWLGDGVMFHFREPGPAVEAALEMIEGIVGAHLPPARVGIHAGPVVFQEGDYFGRTVNIAARIAGYARPGEVLVSQEVVDASEGDGVTFSEIGTVELKGVSGSLRLHSAHRDG